MVHVGSTYQGTIEWKDCEYLPESNVILTVTAVHHVAYFNNQFDVRATIVSDSTKFDHPHPVASPMHGHFDFAKHQLVLVPDDTEFDTVHHPYTVICTFYFGDHDHADCTVNEVTSLHQCAKVRMVKV